MQFGGGWRGHCVWKGATNMIITNWATSTFIFCYWLRFNQKLKAIHLELPSTGLSVTAEKDAVNYFTFLLRTDIELWFEAVGVPITTNLMYFVVVKSQLSKNNNSSKNLLVRMWVVFSFTPAKLEIQVLLKMTHISLNTVCHKSFRCFVCCYCNSLNSLVEMNENHNSKGQKRKQKEKNWREKYRKLSNI